MMMCRLIDSVLRLMNAVHKQISVDWSLQLKWIIGDALRCGFHIDAAVKSLCGFVSLKPCLNQARHDSCDK